ncbi:MAG: hypothetical protein PHV74_14770 [Dehalococcoidia bacterium]|nr:hypothetical protein [Dehalococcoidia bacterium]
MNIALCVKQVPDVAGPFSLTEETVSLDNAGLVNIVNPADLAALAMVRKALPPGTAKVTAMSVGPKSVERALRVCVALGADKTVRVWDSALTAGAHGPDVIARVLAATISSIGFDLIVCGSRGICGGSGYVGPALAEYLCFAQLCSVSHLEISPARDALTVHRRLDRGDREIVACKLPAVITVDEGTAEIPYASFPDVLASERMEIPVIDLASIGLKSSDIESACGGRFLHYVPPRPRTKKSPAPAKALSPLEQMQQAMLGGGATKKGSDVIEGKPQKVAQEIVRFLVSNGILPREHEGRVM